MKFSLSQRLERYFANHPDQFIAKGFLCDLARSVTGATGEHTGRRLRELCEEGKIEVEYRKGCAFYRYRKQPQKTQRRSFIEIINGVAVEKFKEIAV